MKKFVAIITACFVILSCIAVSFANESAAEVAYGDCNGDGKIDLSDVTLMLKKVADWDVQIDSPAADVNVDGRLNLKDVTLLLQSVAKWDVTLGIKETKPPVHESYFPEMDFGGEELKILHYGATSTDYFDECIWADELSTSNMGQSTAHRNKKVENEYNVKITAEECGPIGEAVKRQMAGQCDFDLIYEWGTRTKGAALDGYLYDLHTLDENHYIDLEGSYWYPQTHDSLTVGGNMYSVPSMISTSAYAYCDMIYVNLNVLYDIGVTDIGYPYNYVHDGQWTYERLIELSLAAEKDVNHNGESDAADRFGGIDGYDILAAMCDEPYYTVNDDGSYSFVPYTERMVDLYYEFYIKAMNIAEVPVGIPEVIGDPYYYQKKEAAVIDSFKDGHRLFMKGNLEMSKKLTDMRDDYGILPMPAMEAGYDYSCRADACAPVFAVPTSISNPEIMIAVDFMAYMSEGIILSTYIEDTLKAKRMEDIRNYDMLDYIIANLDYRWSDYYMAGATPQTARDQVISTGDFASVAKRYGVKCEEEVRDMTVKLALLG